MHCTVCRQQLRPDAMYCPHCHSATPALGAPYAEAERRLAQILAKQRSGSKNEAVYEAEIQQIIVRDEAGNTWWLGGQHGAWHWYNGRTWERRDPVQYQYANSPVAQPAAPSYTQPAKPAVIQQESSQSESKRRLSPFIIIGCVGIVTLVLIIGGIVGLILMLDDQDADENAGANTLTETAAFLGVDNIELLADALTEEVQDHRPQTLEMMGRPDVFSIIEMDVDGHKLVRESWVYYGLATQVDFINGEAVFTSSLDPVPEETIFPAWYDPELFSAGMTAAEIIQAASSASPAGTVPESIMAEATSEEFPGGEILIGDQILIGVFADRVVYIETVALFPEEIAQ